MDLPAGISTLQRTDRWIGVPLCAILTLVRKILGSTKPPGPRQVHSILFVKFAEQGSTVLAYPAILRAIEMVGRENVYFVVFEDNRVILDAMEIIPDANVITIATKSLFGLATGALQAVLQARKIGVDAVVDLEFLTRFSAILTFTTGAKSRVGFQTFLAKNRATHLDPPRLIYKRRGGAGCRVSNRRSSARIPWVVSEESRPTMREPGGSRALRL